jgi:tetratricopeptide (TPR) repeat protein
MKRRTLVAAVVLLLCVPAMAGSPSDSKTMKKALKHQEQGMKALQKGQLEKAESEFQKSVKAFSALPQAHMGLGHLALQRKDFERALAEYEAVIAGYAEMGGRLADIEAKRYTDAQREITGLREVLSQLQSPTLKMEDYERQARVLSVENQIRQLELVQHPSHGVAGEAPGEVYFFLGNALFNLGRLDEAIEAWRTCTSKSPDHPDVYNNLAVVYWKQNRLEEAKKSMEKAEELGFKIHPNFKADLERAMAQAAP